MRKPVCIECEEKMELINGISLLEYIDEEKTKPYKLWNADMAVCPECGVQVIFRFADAPAAQDHEEGFAAAVAEARKGMEERSLPFVEVY